jgi:hypothetical protein
MTGNGISKWGFGIIRTSGRPIYLVPNVFLAHTSTSATLIAILSITLEHQNNFHYTFEAPMALYKVYIW